MSVPVEPAGGEPQTEKQNRWNRIKHHSSMKALRWALSPLAKAESVTALATVVLAIFAIFAWTAAQGQLDELRSEQDALMVIPTIDAPSYNPDNGQVLWNFYTQNIGRRPAYNLRILKFIKIGDKTFQPNNAPDPKPELGVEGSIDPPGVPGYGTAFSREGIDKTYYDALLKVPYGVGLLVIFEYRTSPSAPVQTEEFCYLRSGNGSVGQFPASACPR